jgi:hypothetical protein
VSTPADDIARDVCDSGPHLSGLKFPAKTLTFERFGDGTYAVIVDGQDAYRGSDTSAALLEFSRHAPKPLWTAVRRGLRDLP